MRRWTWMFGVLVACGPSVSGEGDESSTADVADASTTAAVSVGSASSGAATTSAGSTSTDATGSSTGASPHPPPPGGLGDWGWGYVRLGTGAWKLALGDFDQDGHLDVYGSSWVQGSRHRIEVLLGQGDGATFTQTFDEVLRVGDGALVGDFNGDGFPDVATARDTTGDELRLLYGDGLGGFEGPEVATLFDSLFFYFGPVVFDANHDPYADFLLTRGCCGEDATVAEGGADGVFSFTTHLTAPWSYFNRSLVIDLDGDGWDDLVATATGEEVPDVLPVSTYFGGPSGLAQAQSFAEGDGIVEGANLVAVDYEGDGGRDVVVATVHGLSTLSVADDGVLSEPVLHPHELEWWPQYVAAIELEAGASQPSFVLSRRHLPDVGQPYTHLSALVEPSGATPTVTTALDLQGRVVATGDFDEDGRDDLVVLEGGENEGEIGIWLSGG